MLDLLPLQSVRAHSGLTKSSGYTGGLTFILSNLNLTAVDTETSVRELLLVGVVLT